MFILKYELHSGASRGVLAHPLSMDKNGNKKDPYIYTCASPRPPPSKILLLPQNQLPVNLVGSIDDEIPASNNANIFVV